LFAIVSLALGVGVTTAIYSVILSLTRTAIQVPNAGQVGLIVGTDSLAGRRPIWRSALSLADFEDLRRSFTTAAPEASAPFYQSAVTASTAEMVSGEAVTGNYFQLLGLAPARGRLIQAPDEDSSARVAVISHTLWRVRLAADPHVVGMPIRIGGQPFEIIGVAPEGFDGLSIRFQTPSSVWIPLSAATLPSGGGQASADAGDRRKRQLSVLVPLAGARSVRALSDEVGAVGARLDRAFPIETRHDPSAAPTREPREWSVGTITAVNRQLDSQFSRVEIVIMAIVGLVLVVACTNLANLVLARGSARTHELAVRRALGASRSRLVVEQLAETGLLAGMGALGAFLVARVLLVGFASINLPVAQATVVQIQPQLDTTTLTWAAVSLLTSLLVFGLGPAIQLTRVQLRSRLASESGGTGQLRWRTRRTLIAVQVMISLSFFLIAAFAVRSVAAEEATPSGIDVDRLALGTLNFGVPPWNEPRARQTVERLMALAEAQPMLRSAAVVSGMPFGMTPYTPGSDVTTLDKPFARGDEIHDYAPFIAATPSVFQTLGVPITRGRGFDARDTAGSGLVAVLSEHTARDLFGTTDVVGREFFLRRFVPTGNAVDQLLIIGVAGDTDSEMRGLRNSGVVYLPLSQRFEPILTFVARTDRDPAELVAPMKALTQRADPDLVLAHASAAAPIVMGRSILMGMVSRLAAGLAVLTMLLGMAGLFGVLSHLVSRRRREMGLRMALGAGPSQIRALVIRDGFQPVASGLIMGYLIAIAVRFIIPFNDRFSANDVVVFALAPIPIIVAAFIACYWPAMKASRVDPNVALKDL
jgi:predicted permease